MGLCAIGEGTAWARVSLASQAVLALGSSHLSLLPDAGCTEVSAPMISHGLLPSAHVLTEVLSLPALNYAS